MQVYCNPHSPWQRGSNENTNGLLRQYFPKRTDLSQRAQAYLDEAADQFNTQPPADPRLEHPQRKRILGP